MQNWRWAVRRKQTVHQGAQAVGFLDDDLGVFLELRLGKLQFQQLRGSTQPSQGVFDFVRKIAYQFPVGLLL